MFEQQVQSEMWEPLHFPFPGLGEKHRLCQYSAQRPVHAPYATVLESSRSPTCTHLP